MAEFAESGGAADGFVADESVLSLLRVYFDLRLPHTRRSNYSEALARYLGDADAMELVGALTRTRDALYNELPMDGPSGPAPATLPSGARRGKAGGATGGIPESHAINVEGVLAATEAYVPHVYRLMRSVESYSGGAMRWEPALQIRWSSGLSLSAMEEYAYGDVVFDLAMTLATKAIAHSARAIDIVRGAGTDQEQYVQAAAQNRIAAGIFQCLAREVLPRWTGAPNDKVSRPCEAFEAVCDAFSHYFVAQAQLLAISRAMFNPKTTPGMLSKLFLGVATEIDTMMSMLKTQAPNHFPRISGDFHIHTGLIKELALGLAIRYMAEAKHKKTECGLALAFFRKAQQHLRVRPSSTEPGLPRPVGAYAALAQPINALIANTQAAMDACERDNRMIYFETIPHETELPDLGVGMVLTPAIPFELSSAEEPVEFHEIENFDEEQRKIKESQTMFGRLKQSLSRKLSASDTAAEGDGAAASGEAAAPASASASASASAAAPSPAATAPAITTPGDDGFVTAAVPAQGIQRSDSDIARELQERLNKGENV